MAYSDNKLLKNNGSICLLQKNKNYINITCLKSWTSYI